MKYVFKFIRRIARVVFFRQILVWGMINMSDWLPIKKIRETESLICFYHPQPVYPVHILLVPKDELQDLSQLKPDRVEFMQDLCEYGQPVR